MLSVMWTSSRIPTLVLVNLAILGGCKEPETPAAVELPPPPATATSPSPEMPLATSAPSASAAPSANTVPSAMTAPTTVATTAPTTVATTAPTTQAVAKPSKPVVGKTCRTDADCGPPLSCALGFNGATFSKTGTCQAGPIIYEGRPLVVDGEVHVARAEPERGAAPAEDVEGGLLEATDERVPAALARLRAAALEEHASVAAFARTVAELVALGAPTWLLAETARALADEVRHASDTFAWVARLGGGALRPGPLEAAAAPLRAGPRAAEALYRDVFRGGAVGETLAAARADEASRAETDPRLAELYRGVADDEARHAALALRTLQWLRETFADLTHVRDEEIAAFRRGQGVRERGLLEPLLATL